ncbi:hypothetical protein Hypma_006993 [Hypsizygus marmoreus]|uniref:Uncharacterized protein n=1 Tax=Hypsizygus marmoreus TaxID=39966 RepID=A0A369KCJ9_HYPMA|nr:hypothetical protein Hypma_006993 [Hypsizygus marmoreus]
MIQQGGLLEAFLSPTHPLRDQNLAPPNILILVPSAKVRTLPPLSSRDRGSCRWVALVGFIARDHFQAVEWGVAKGSTELGSQLPSAEPLLLRPSFPQRLSPSL